MDITVITTGNIWQTNKEPVPLYSLGIQFIEVNHEYQEILLTNSDKC